MELVKYKKFVYIPEPEGQAKLSKANFVGVLHSQYKWYDFSKKKRWHLGLRGIIKKYGSDTELCPETWNDIKFGDGMTVFDLHKKLIEKRRKNEFATNQKVV